MLTCPCVTIEWKTPPIHAVEVSAGFVGREMAAGAQQVPVRPLHAQLFCAEHYVAVGAVEERE